MAVKIVTDSTADLPPELTEQMGVTVVPAIVIFDGEELLDGVDVTPDAFFQRLPSASQLPKTSQATPAQFAEVYERIKGEGHDIVSVHISAKLSGTLNSALQGKEAAGVDAEVIDAGGASLWTGMAALVAARKAAEGASQADVAQAVRDASARMGIFFFVDTLEYLVKGGRIGKAQGFVGGVLNIKPILYINDGELHQYGRVRSRRKAVERLVEIARAAAPLEEVGVLHGAAPDEAQALAADLADLTPGVPPIVSSVGPAVGAHTGPGTLGVVFRRA